jgi:hypothetical protein
MNPFELPDEKKDGKFHRHGEFEIAISYLSGFANKDEDAEKGVFSGGFVIGWFWNGGGFGELMVKQKDGELVADTEAMGADFVAAVLNALAKSVKIIG